ncbi:TPA: ankyrin repeat domain-containing protein [Burkholderia vietnamiensis]|nr:ankyrin repeat domain-containing protein [Burkholderia vietnamiensis]
MEIKFTPGEIVLSELLNDEQYIQYKSDTPSIEAEPFAEWGQDCLDSELETAFRNRDLEAMELWLSRGADVDYEFGRFLEEAAERGDLDIVKLLVKHNATLGIMETDPDYDRNGALNMAVLGNYTEVAKFLIENGAPVNDISDFYGIALHSASARGNIEMVQLLVENGADVNLTPGPELKESAITKAFNNRHYEVANYLADNGADMNHILENHLISSDQFSTVRQFIKSRELNNKLESELPNRAIKDPMTMRDEQAALTNGATKTKSNKLKI